MEKKFNTGDKLIANINGKLHNVKVICYHKNFDMYLVEYNGNEVLMSKDNLFNPTIQE